MQKFAVSIAELVVQNLFVTFTLLSGLRTSNLENSLIDHWEVFFMEILQSKQFMRA
jgi:hypothetical protein